MKNKLSLLSSLICFTISCSFAQNSSDSFSIKGKQHIVGFDANSMLSQLVPFNTISQSRPYPALVSRRLLNGKGIRTSFGLDLDYSNAIIRNAYAAFGFTKQQPIGNKLIWIKGFEARAYLYPTDDGFLGVAPYWGIEYKFSKYFSVSTESSIEIGIEPYWSYFEELVISAVPPVHIQCHFVIPKKSR